MIFISGVAAGSQEYGYSDTPGSIDASGNFPVPEYEHTLTIELWGGGGGGGGTIQGNNGTQSQVQGLTAHGGNLFAGGGGKGLGTTTAPGGAGGSAGVANGNANTTNQDGADGQNGSAGPAGTGGAGGAGPGHGKPYGAGGHGGNGVGAAGGGGGGASGAYQRSVFAQGELPVGLVLICSAGDHGNYAGSTPAVEGRVIITWT
jgi:hypothetical protein